MTKVVEGKMTIFRAKALGFKVDTCCYPHVAYKGQRFDPDEVGYCFTPLEARLQEELEAQKGEEYPGQAPCPHCFESSGYMVRFHPATWTDPEWADSDPNKPCTYCNATGTVGCELVTLEDLEELASEERQMTNVINHSPTAIELHGRNHATLQVRARIDQPWVDVGPLGMMTISPPCVGHSVVALPSRRDLLNAEGAADNFDGLGKPMVDFATGTELRELFDMEPGEQLSACIPVCAGEWRQEGGGWRFHRHAGDEQ